MAFTLELSNPMLWLLLIIVLLLLFGPNIFVIVLALIGLVVVINRVAA